MSTIKARFDGHVFVPQEPVDLPVGWELEIALPSDQAPPPVLPTHTKQGRSIGEMARAFDALGRPLQQESAPLPIDPDEYPLF
jgi:hypothetical protein